MLNILPKKISLGFIKELTIFCSLVFLSVVFALNPNYAKTTANGFLLWLTLIVPALFPYFFVTAFISRLNLTVSLGKLLSPFARRVFNISGTAFFCYLTGALTGYPTGTKLVAEYKEKGLLSIAESERASMVCSNASPMFLIGSVGSVMFHSLKLGLVLFLTHILSSIVSGLIFAFYKRKEKPVERAIPHATATAIFYDSVYSAISTALMVGGVVALFHLLTQILLDLNLLSILIAPLSLVFETSTAKGVAIGIFEYTSGLSVLSKTLSLKSALPICALLCGFGGFSIIMQSVAYLKKAKIKTAPFLIAKITVAVINFIIGYLFSITFF